jgi:hypothetical protein
VTAPWKLLLTDSRHLLATRERWLRCLDSNPLEDARDGARCSKRGAVGDVSLRFGTAGGQLGGQRQELGGEGTVAHDAVEAALAAGLSLAAQAGQWEAVAQLAKELEARRLARGSSKVVALSSRGEKSRR